MVGVKGIHRKFSVVTPTFNGARFLRETLNSVRGQSLPPYEVVIVDDCSTDDSVEIVSQWAQECGNDFPVVQFKTPCNSGSPALPLKIGIEAATCEWILVLEQDDLFCPEKLLQCSLALQKHPSVGFLTHRGECLQPKGRTASVAQFHFSRDAIIRSKSRPGADCFSLTSEQALTLALKHSMYPSGFPGIAFSKQAYEKCGAITCKYRVATDYAFLLALSQTAESCHIPKALYQRRSHTGNLSHASSLSFLEVLSIVNETLKDQPQLWKIPLVPDAIAWRTIESAWNVAAFGFRRQALAMIESVEESIGQSITLRFQKHLTLIMPVYRSLFMRKAHSSEAIADSLVQVASSLWSKQNVRPYAIEQ